MEKYPETKNSEELYYPSFLFKEMIVTLFLFILVTVILPMIFPAGLEDPADPTDNLYNPKPVWYFMPLYQLLKYFPGRLETIGTTIIPACIFTVLLILPFIDKNPAKAPTERPIAMALMLITVLATIVLTILGFMT